MNEQKTLGEISCPSIPGAEAPGWGEHNDTGKRKGQPKQNPLRWTDDPRSWRKRLESPQDPQSKEGTDSLRTWILRSLTISQPSKGYARKIAAQINHPWVEFPSWMDHCQEALLVVSGWEKKKCNLSAFYNSSQCDSSCFSDHVLPLRPLSHLPYISDARGSLLPFSKMVLPVFLCAFA